MQGLIRIWGLVVPMDVVNKGMCIRFQKADYSNFLWCLRKD